MSYDPYYRDGYSNDRRGHDKLGRYLHAIDPFPTSGSSYDGHGAAPRSAAGSRHHRHLDHGYEPPRRRHKDAHLGDRSPYDSHDHSYNYFDDPKPGRRQRSEPRPSKQHHNQRDDRASRQDRPRSSSVRAPNCGQVATSAAVAGVVEALKSRHYQDSSARTITAATVAGMVDALVGKERDKKGAQHVVESVVAGLAADRIAYGRGR